MERFLKTLKPSGANYEYLNARVRAMASRLLTDFQLKELAAKLRGLDDFVDFLSKTDYAFELEVESLRDFSDPLAYIEEVIAKGVGKSINSVYKMAEGEAKDLIGVYLMQGDLNNMRLCLRHLFTETAPPKELKGWFYWGELPYEFYEEVASSGSVYTARDIVILWKHPLGYVFTEALLYIIRARNIAEAEKILLLGYIEESQKRIKRYFSSSAETVGMCLALYVDILNLTAYLKGSDVFIKGGLYIDSQKRWKLLKARGLRILRQTPYYEILAEADKPYQKEERLKRWYLKTLCDLYRGDPLAIDIPWGYISKKLKEETNLRILAVGLYFEKTEKEILSRMII